MRQFVKTFRTNLKHDGQTFDNETSLYRSHLKVCTNIPIARQDYQKNLAVGKACAKKRSPTGVFILAKVGAGNSTSLAQHLPPPAFPVQKNIPHEFE